MNPRGRDGIWALLKAASIAAIFMLVIIGPCFSMSDNPDVVEGKRIYVEMCKTCHGADGRGLGAMAFNPPAADLTSADVQAKLDSRLYNSIHEGRSNTAMGAWKHSLSPKEVLDVMSYIRTFRNSPSSP